MAVRATAAMSRLAAEYLDDNDGLPCADFKLLAPLKRSAEYRAIRPRVSEIKPLDAWQLDALHYFVFALKRPADAPADAGDPVALFIMGTDPAPISALVIAPKPDGAQADVQDLRKPGAPFKVRL